MSDAHGPAHYKKIYYALLVLLAISVAGPMVGEKLDMQWLTLVTAFGIAFVKAFLVIKHFMHLTIEKTYIQYMLIGCLGMMALFLFGTAPDVMKHEGQNWTNDAAKKEVLEKTAAHKKMHAEGGAAAHH
ncbi:MAG: cytochrome C oxidase subunit IV family protein [Deltaproteobacteria bacterium]|nr:cytochrome C oxidase subunit IV family protein [Deltaproteobacteria bacterium]